MCGACSAPPAGRDPVLAGFLDPIVHRLADTGATVTARVLELPSRRELYAIDVDEPYLPASNMKIVVSAAGLDMFGPEHTLQTYLAFDGENLWLIGTGDPGIGDPRIAQSQARSTTTVLEEWTRALQDRGVNRVPGHLYYYDGALEARQIHPSWDEDDLVHWYAAPVSGLCFNDNCVDITVCPTQDGQPAGVEIAPPVEGIVIVNQCISGARASPTIVRVPYADAYILGGGCRERVTLKSKPVNNPGAFFADALRTHLAAAGIVIEGETRQAATPPDGAVPPRPKHLIATHESGMSDLMWRINKNSQNLFAECLCKLTGQAYEAQHGRSSPGSWRACDKAVRAFLRRHDIDDGQFALADGSGLSRRNRVTARLITDLLAVMFDHPYGEAYRASLAEPGKLGTLNSRMTDLSGHVFAKTGYIRGVRALSGYVHTHSDRWLCFSIIYNNIPASVKPFNDLQDEACRVLVDWPHLTEPAATALVQMSEKTPDYGANRDLDASHPLNGRRIGRAALGLRYDPALRRTGNARTASR
jgi:D-alanyl-D-alanine carboxypeptidase/D-alanyl-D-alanine-endopeptidase (penicillin-binding protein 4)